MAKRPHRKTPCRACPWRREAGAGWLGASSPERFALQVLAEQPLPCHLTIDYNDPLWEEKWAAQQTGKLCAGALIQSANLKKLPRDLATPVLKKSDKVFMTLNEFITFHRSSTRSWPDDEDKKGKKAWKDLKKIGWAPLVLAGMDIDES